MLALSSSLLQVGMYISHGIGTLICHPSLLLRDIPAHATPFYIKGTQTPKSKYYLKLKVLQICLTLSFCSGSAKACITLKEQ